MKTGYINKNNPIDINEIKEYLGKHGILYDNPEATVVTRDKTIVATGSLEGSVIKYLYVDEEYKGKGLINTIYNELLSYLLSRDRLSHFVFTDPSNESIFTSMGLTKIVSTDKVVLLEGGFRSYGDWINSVKKKIDMNSKTRGAVVANCNPMTLGHRYLLEEAAKKVDELLVFILEEDLSEFSTETRYGIVKKEVADIPNVVVVKSGKYIISQATFPSYFLKQVDDKLDVYTILDATIFGEKIAKDLGITVRFLGEEPEDVLTNRYNQILYDVLKEYNVEVEILPRIKKNREIISASKVRKLLDQGKTREALEFVTDGSKDYIIKNYTLN